TQINPWAVSTSGDFDRIVVFDDTANNRFVSPFQEANALTQYAGLREAALNSLAASDESTEGEFLLPGATYQNSYRSDYRDFEINVGTNYYCRRWRVAAGYRHVRLDESSTFLMQGTFDALDVDDGARPGDMMNDPNDGLSHGAMIEAGFVNVAGGADGFDARVLNTNPPVPPDIIAYETQGRAYNELNGGQFTGAFLLVDREVFQLESVFKAGIYRNEVSGQVRETVAGLGNDDSVYQRALTDDRMKPAFVGQIGFQGILALTDYINVRAGYDVIFLSGVALGPDQWLGLSTDNFGATTYRVRTGSMVVHGGNVGLEFLW
ncbi:MAG: hypothetical protein KDA80_14290, partial [Planctomycetaceae bacterium]|nr:hypothetical protein [Planctomycetaceae bacterium]